MLKNVCYEINAWVKLIFYWIFEYVRYIIVYLVGKIKYNRPTCIDGLWWGLPDPIGPALLFPPNQRGGKFPPVLPEIK